MHTHSRDYPQYSLNTRSQTIYGGLVETSGPYLRNYTSELLLNYFLLMFGFFNRIIVTQNQYKIKNFCVFYDIVFQNRQLSYISGMQIKTKRILYITYETSIIWCGLFLKFALLLK